jgi:hypothetical protein
MPWINVAPILQLNSGRLYRAPHSKRASIFVSHEAILRVSVDRLSGSNPLPDRRRSDLNSEGCLIPAR